MKYSTDDNIEFMYGKACEKNKDPNKINLLRGIGQSIVRSAVTFAVPFIMAISPTSTSALHILPADAQHFDIGLPHALTVKQLSISLREARDYLFLTQEDIANITGISLSSVQKFEQMQVVPHEVTTEKYVNILELEALYKRVFKNKKYLMKTYLKTPLSIYGNKTPIGFAASRQNGLFELITTEKRIHE